MQPEQLPDRYHDVVFAANRVLSALSDGGADLPVPVAEAMTRLRAALSGPPAVRSGPGEPADPRRDLISIRDWRDTPPGGSVARPYPLTVAGAEAAADLEKARAKESEMYDAARQGGVTLSMVRSLMLVQLLRELAARVRPGAEVGPIDADDSLSRAAADLAADLRGWGN
jgi:hypothetical protein